MDSPTKDIPILIIPDLVPVMHVHAVPLRGDNNVLEATTSRHVSAKDRLLTCAVTFPNDGILAPGRETCASVDVCDRDGAPVPNSAVSLCVVDLGLCYL